MRRPLLAFALLLAAATPAFAQPPSVRSVVVEPEAPGPLHFYGYGALACDAATLLLAAAADRVFLGTGGYLLCSPIVHAAHGNAGRSALSLGVRAAATTLIFTTVSDAKEGELAKLGVLAGLGAVSLLDAFVLGLDRHPEPRHRAFAPTVNMGGGMASFGVAGTF